MIRPSTFNLFAIMCIIAFNISNAQVGIGTTTPDASASLEIDSANSGLLIPRVPLTNVTNGTTPINTPATSLLVYNNNAGITGGSGTGFYYWDGTEWVKLETRPSSDWTLLGNAGTNANANFIGTTDAVDFITRTNNLERMRVRSDGRVLVNTTTLLAGDNFTVRSNVAGDHPINGYTDITGVAIFGSTDAVNSLTYRTSAGSFDSQVRAIYANGGAANAIAIDASAGNPTGGFNVNGAAGLFNAAESAVFAYADNQNATRYAGRFIANPIAANTSNPTAMLASNINATNEAGGIFSSDDYGIYATTNGNNTGFAVYAVEDLGVGQDIYGNDDLFLTDDANIGGDANITGTITAGVKAFTIDHPTDPTNKVLRHYSTESDELTNIYKGNVVFDLNGEAKAYLPKYYKHINTNPSYQLTAIGAKMPDLHIKQEVKNNIFIIAGGTPGKKASWTILAQRNDKFAQFYKEELVNEIDKTDNQKGKYIHPEAWDVSIDKKSFITKKGVKYTPNTTNETYHKTSELNKTKTAQPRK